MGKQLDLLKDKPRTLYFKYLLPSVSASLVTSIYILADTIMIGRGCGAAALAALNLVLPVFALLFAFGMLFGIGGGVLYSVARGNNDNEHAKNIWSTALSLNILSAILILVFGGLFFEKLCYFLGADENSITMVMDYAKYVVFGAPAYMFSAFLQAFVRNDKQPKRAMIAVITGAITNIILDYIFIFNFKMGLSGGAAATLIGNITRKENEVYLHCHINFSDASLNTFGGHLVKAVISATGEIIITKIDGEVNRRFDEEIGLNLFDFSK